MRIIITGATGFVGRALVKMAVKMNYTVAVLLRLDSNVSNINDFPQVKKIFYNKLSSDELINEISSWQPDVFYHLAWKGVTGNFRNEPYQFTENISLTMDSVMLASKTGCTSWIGAGSQAEYGLHQGVITENTVCSPYNAYGKAKLAVGIAAQGLCEVLNIKGAWGRIFSTYGPDDSSQYLIPYVIDSLKNKQSPAVSACEQVWDYLYVDDAATAFLKAAETGLTGTFNIGSGKAVILKDVLDHIHRLMDARVAINYGAIPYAANQVMHLEANISRLSNEAGWKPVVSLIEGLEKTISHQVKAL